MTRGTAFGLILLGVMGILTSAAAEETPPLAATPAPTQEATPPPVRTEYKDIITLYGGAFHVGHSAQSTILTGRENVPQKSCLFVFIVCWYDGGSYVTSPLASTFDNRTHGVFSATYEHLFRGRWAVGTSYMQMGNAYTIPAVSPGAGEVTTRHLYTRFGRYFRDPDTLRPFVAVGLGLVIADFTGPINPRGIGYGAQAIAGLRYQVDHLSFTTEVRAIGSHIPWRKGQGTGSVYGSLDISGVGAFVGMGYAFK